MRQSRWRTHDLLRELNLTNVVHGTTARLRVLQPDPTERGFKDTVKANPGYFRPYARSMTCRLV